MVTETQAVALAKTFVRDELGRTLTVLSVRHMTTEVINEMINRPPLAATDIEKQALMDSHRDHWEVSFELRLSDGEAVDSPVVVCISDDDATAKWEADWQRLQSK